MNPDEWPHVDLKTSKGSVKGQRYVGLGGENIDNLEVNADSAYRTTQWERRLKLNEVRSFCVCCQCFELSFVTACCGSS